MTGRRLVHVDAQLMALVCWQQQKQQQQQQHNLWQFKQ
jgi:hypothetical protein